MIAVFDTSPLCYLILLGEAELAPRLLGEIVIPIAVRLELLAPGAPAVVRSWVENSPSWLRVVETPEIPAQIPKNLHPGEREAIGLTLSLPADLVVLDERAARQAARDLGLEFTGLLGLLDLAASDGLIDLPIVIQRLRQTSFRASPTILANLLKRHLEEP